MHNLFNKLRSKKTTFPLFYVFIFSTILTGCTNQQLAYYFGWMGAVGVLLSGVGGIGLYYFNNPVDKKETKEDTIQIIDLGSEVLKDWRVEKDSPIIIETIDILITANFQAHFEKGDSFNLKDATTWDFGGHRLILDFVKKLNAGEISFDETSGSIPVKHKFFGITTEAGAYQYRPLAHAELSYNFYKLYYLTNTSTLPNSKIIKDFDTKIANRIFNEQDLVNFTFDQSKAVSNIDDLPKQQGKTLRFLLKPRVNITN